MLDGSSIVTAGKRSLRGGNVFTDARLFTGWFHLSPRGSVWVQGDFCLVVLLLVSEYLTDNGKIYDKTTYFFVLFGQRTINERCE